MLNQKIIKFATSRPRTIAEIAQKFEIKDSQVWTLRRRLKEEGIETKDTRGRKKIEF